MAFSKNIVLVFLVLLLQDSWASDDVRDETGCPIEFHKLCTCKETLYERTTRYVVNCTNTGFTSTSILEHMPPETQVLIFTGNNIPQLPWNVFGTSNYEKLRIVDMSNNGIQEIKGKSYHRVSNVERLILNHNNIFITGASHHPRIFSNFVNLRELHLTNAFAETVESDVYLVDLHDIFSNSNLTKLIKLHLEQNEIRFFSDPEVFCDLQSLMDLHLGDNRLTGINSDLSCLHQLRFVDLEKNRISRLPLAALNMLDEFPKRRQNLTIDLSDNPFTCDCHIRDLYSWLQTTKVEVRNKNMLRCQNGIPSTNHGEKVIDLKQIQCAMVHPPESHATFAVLMVLIAVICCLLVVVAYMNRKWIVHRVHPILETVSRKVQYTSIGKEEQEMDV